VAYSGRCSLTGKEDKTLELATLGWR